MADAEPPMAPANSWSRVLRLLSLTTLMVNLKSFTHQAAH